MKADGCRSGVAPGLLDRSQGLAEWTSQCAGGGARPSQPKSNRQLSDGLRKLRNLLQRVDEMSRWKG
jgi:hypothetical protein